MSAEVRRCDGCAVSAYAIFCHAVYGRSFSARLPREPRQRLSAAFDRRAAAPHDARPLDADALHAMRHRWLYAAYRRHAMPLPAIAASARRCRRR